MNRIACHAFFIILCLSSISPVHAATVIVKDIRFAGNRVTRPDVMLREVVVGRGRPASAAEIERSRQNIMNLGLFRSVWAEMRPDGVLLFTVREKRYLLAYPLLSRNESRLSPGLRIRWENIGGRNHSLRFRYRRSDAGDATSGIDESLRFSFNNPRLAGTWLGLDASLTFDRTPVETLSGSTVTSRYRRDHYTLGLHLMRWLVAPGPSRGWWLTAGVVIQDRRYTHESGTIGLYDNARDIALTGGIGFTDVNDHLYSRAGRAYGLTATFGIRQLGSDFGYNRIELFWRRYHWLGAPHHNLNLQLKLGLADGGGFSEAPFELGGARTLRGYSDLEGEAYLQANIEYLRPLFGKASLRGVVFVDIGGVWPRVRDIGLSGLKAAVGLGVRVKLKRFVRLDLRVDVAYNLESGETEFHAGTKNTF